jgi:hypothetical protein
LLVPASQTGFVPPHWAAVVHTVHVPEATSQVVTAPVHNVVFVAEQTPHVPASWQAGVAPPHSPSPAHPRHTCVAVSHVGFAAPHWAFVRQPTQVAVVTSHTDVAPTQREAFVAEHCPHAPPA